MISCKSQRVKKKGGVEQNIKVRAYIFLLKNGKLVEENETKELPEDCRRTKTYAFNESHVLLRFGLLSFVYNRTNIHILSDELLFQYDKIFYFLNKIEFYNELDGTWMIKNIIQVF